MPVRSHDIVDLTADACEAMARALGWDEAEVEQARALAREEGPAEARLFLRLAARKLEAGRP